MTLFLLFSFTIALFTTASALISVGNKSTFTHEMLVGYDKEVAPFRGRTNTVQVGIYLNTFYSVNEQSMDYSINIYLRQQWEDPRLRFKSRRENSSDLDMIKLGEELWHKIWIPDLFFRNEKTASFHDVTIPNRLVRVYSNGLVYYATKLSLNLACPMELHKYPHDTQRCPMQMESFGNTMDVVNFTWLEPHPVEIDPSIQLPQYNLTGHEIFNCSQKYATGTYSCLEIKFYLKRSAGYYLIQVYIPTFLIVILSWVSFWISMDAIPARVTIGLLTVLTMTTQKAGAGQSLPRVSYVKAIDVWLCVCLVFVFLSLLEFALVNVLSRHDKMVEQKRKRNRLASDAIVNVGRVVSKVFCWGSIRSFEWRPGNADVYRINTRHKSRDNPTHRMCLCPIFVASRANTVRFSAFRSRQEPDSCSLDSAVSVYENCHHRLPNSRKIYTMDSNLNNTSLPGSPTPSATFRKPSHINLDIERLPSADPQKITTSRSRAEKVEHLARFFFPISFLVFNFIYWNSYLFWMSKSEAELGIDHASLTDDHLVD